MGQLEIPKRKPKITYIFGEEEVNWCNGIVKPPSIQEEGRSLWGRTETELMLDQYGTQQLELKTGEKIKNKNK